MSVQARRERERARRQQLIITTARDLAEAEGWDAVTTRRLAQLIEYSQPVLYSHFAGKDAIVGAVALEGFAELAAELGRRRGLEPLVRAYVDFAEANPAVYDAMFTLSTPLRFAQEETPEPMKAGFNAILEVLRPLAGEKDLGIFTEVVWSALHGQVMLTRGGRTPKESQRKRLAMFVDLVHAGAVA
ncbi:TetR/AcrR family transcriptional regulator [Actinocrispum wychmicini]|uniref:TetR family transcriptional regulator n=1 Tax=Actinocrispum wychmicini TaxID=1213861 RepID=A0A4R2K1D3_9PSEU|nr:TetR/AcrR family transcriptional regulator [Actinocrispum wychmicini]TCO65507.1 TetR family transcriptional regulator [Actinocrispum wychmicini]